MGRAVEEEDTTEEPDPNHVEPYQSPWQRLNIVPQHDLS